MVTESLRVEIVSPEGEIYSGSASMVHARGTEGELGIAPGHLQLLTSIAPGAIRLEREEEDDELMYVSGGILEVQPDMVTILADTIERPQDVNEAAAKEAKAAAEKQLLTSKSGVDRTKAQQELDVALAKLRVLELVRLKKIRR